MLEELLVGAALDDLALVEDENEIGVHHGGNPVTHDDDRALSVMAAQVAEDSRFGVRVDGRKGVVEDQDAR